MSQHDIDPTETEEWLAAFQSVIQYSGKQRAQFLLDTLLNKASQLGSMTPYALTTPYRNSIPKAAEPPYPGDVFMERRIRSIIRWNALAMVMRANKESSDIGGHIASFSSSATLYDIGFNHFFRAPSDQHGGDLVYVQGHSSPGVYARSFLEGRLSEERLDHFRREVDGEGLSSYPHPWLMPDYWQFPTVSMGLGPLQAIYQAHFMKYLTNRGLVDNQDRKVWAYIGDGETDEPETLGAIALAGREKLDNLIFVVNCNLQRLDGPVRGNGKIIQELEGQFRGAGWNVIKVVWGRHWDPLLEKDKNGVLERRMNEVVDGEYQNYKTKGGSYTREHFFGAYPELLELVKDYTDEQLYQLNRGGHDPYKIYAAYAAAASHKGQPTVILAKTVKGYGMGQSGEAQNKTHSVKKLEMESLKAFRDRFDIPVSDEQLESLPYYRPDQDSAEMRYMNKQREKLGGHYPVRRSQSEALAIPSLASLKAHLKGSNGREISTTMAFVRLLSTLVKDKKLGERIVPIIPDEARTFGMEGMFRQLGIYSAVGQLYDPHDSGQLMYYKEDITGRILEEGINEAGAMAAWIAAATSYSSNNFPMVPFYIFYSMFGFQRIGDLAWAAGDIQARGFLLGGTAGRTTLNGEGLQHQDGHSHVLASTIPNCRAYDPTYGYELTTIIQHGLQEMYGDQKSVYYYITVMNENYEHPDMPEGAEEGIIKGMYLLKEDKTNRKARVQLMGSGTILREVEAAAEYLSEKYDIACDVWSVTSFNELGRDVQSVDRWNMLHADKKPKLSYVKECLQNRGQAAVAATDYMKAYSDQIRKDVPMEYVTLGTDGFGRSDTRQKLRNFFEVDRDYICIAALYALSQQGVVKPAVVKKAMKEFNIDAEKIDPMLL
ncbi:pyruvate dehydrogenase (acetyl-transferring), homodimeric type [Litoribrevibacter albus]|uniref:Pyruvate dehydrogenase E1 component n=1 Tax=Litoribrevibacter albus TaxID=1473156 RepID=A0AA37SC04_9GAMM|nr:pyruvate dehydrogenase (acetyl-transferring), homodimeric type [Litoribrevibacter albus]GLQ33322.1 pyruvate dehydrogenase E1 component [Litoribrevibacter albus]